MTATMADLLTPPEPSSRFSRWQHLTGKERADACYLAMVADWPLRTDLVWFDTDKNLVMVQREPGLHGSVVVSVCSREAEATMESIERRFGVAARARAEEVAGG